MSAATRVIPVSEADQRVRKGYRVGEAAWLLGMSYDKTLRLIHDELLGARKVGTSFVVPAREIDRFLASAVKDAA